MEEILSSPWAVGYNRLWPTHPDAGHSSLQPTAWLKTQREPGATREPARRAPPFARSPPSAAARTLFSPERLAGARAASRPRGGGARLRL